MTSRTLSDIINFSRGKIKSIHKDELVDIIVNSKDDLVEIKNADVCTDVDQTSKFDQVVSTLEQISSRLLSCEKKLSLLDEFSLNIKKLDEKITNLENIKVIANKNTNLIKNLENLTTNLTRRLDQVEKTNAETANPINNPTVNNVIKNIKSREQREKNVVIFGYKESSDEINQPQTTQSIVTTLADLLDVQISESDVSQCLRLGSKAQDRTRPILVSFKELAKKSSIMKNRGKLHSKNSGVFLNDDMSQEERASFRELRDLAKQQESDDTSGEWMYRVRGPPWNLHIKKIKKQTPQ